MVKERNQFIDIMRGLAMLMVVFGHTMTGATTDSQNSLLFNIIWTLQMPLFILISGYVTRYSKELRTGLELLTFIKKRTVAYLLPWIIWTVLIRGIILKSNIFLNARYILWHMDTGYWFLFTIWTINIIYGLSIFLSNKIAVKMFDKIFVTGVFYAIGMLFLGVMGIMFGMSFLCIKLTLYYMPFFFIGYFYGRISDRLRAVDYGKRIVDFSIFICLVVWFTLLKRYNFFYISDNLFGIAIRILASLTGCIAIFGLCFSWFENKKIFGRIKAGCCWCGIHSLEIYISHNLFLNLINMIETPNIMSVNGVGLTCLNFSITMLVVAIVVELLNQNSFCKLIFFGKINFK